MAVTVILADGSQHKVNGRYSQIIEWITVHREELSKRERVEIEIHCAGEHVTIAPKMIESLAPVKD